MARNPNVPRSTSELPAAAVRDCCETSPESDHYRSSYIYVCIYYYYVTSPLKVTIGSPGQKERRRLCPAALASGALLRGRVSRSGPETPGRTTPGGHGTRGVCCRWDPSGSWPR